MCDQRSIQLRTPIVWCALKMDEYRVISKVTQLGTVVPRPKQIRLFFPAKPRYYLSPLSLYFCLSFSHTNTLAHIPRWCWPKANESRQTWRMDEAAVIVWGGEEAPVCWNSLGSKRNEIQALICQGVCLLFPRLCTVWICMRIWEV